MENKKKNCGVLSGNEIKALGIIDENFSEYSLKSASYDFCLGDEYYSPSSREQKIRQVKEIIDKTYHQDFDKWIKGKNDFFPLMSKLKLKNENDDEDENIIKIEPFSTVIISTKETLKVPLNVVGYFGLRIKYAMKGLVLQVGPQIEPGSVGQLFGLLLNFSDKTVKLKKGAPILTAEFSYLCEPVESGSKRNKVSLEEFIKKNNAEYDTLGSFLGGVKKLQEEIDETHKDIKLNVETHFRKRMNYLWLIAIPLFFALFIPFVTLQITNSTYNKGHIHSIVGDIVEHRINLGQDQQLKEKYEELQERYLEMSGKVDSLSRLLDSPRIVTMNQ